MYDHVTGRIVNFCSDLLIKEMQAIKEIKLISIF